MSISREASSAHSGTSATKYFTKPPALVMALEATDRPAAPMPNKWAMRRKALTCKCQLPAHPANNCSCKDSATSSAAASGNSAREPWLATSGSEKAVATHRSQSFSISFPEGATRKAGTSSQNSTTSLAATLVAWPPPPPPRPPLLRPPSIRGSRSAGRSGGSTRSAGGADAFKQNSELSPGKPAFNLSRPNTSRASPIGMPMPALTMLPGLGAIQNA
mmetsp:Transcript_65586/g.213564  ORF Transcript_65586/g.213564 Transcript_65586/m.213564 type:complete len:218 (-) Transcript_65586:33-686(-)